MKPAVLCVLILAPLAACAGYQPPDGWTVHSRDRQELRASSGDGARLLIKWRDAASADAVAVLQQSLNSAPARGWQILEQRKVALPDGTGAEAVLESAERLARGQETLWLIRVLVQPQGKGVRVTTAELLARAPIFRHHRLAVEAGLADLVD